MSSKQTLLKIGLPVIIVLLGLIVFVFLKSLKQEPQQEIKQDLGILVEVFTVKNHDWQVTVTGTGAAVGQRRRVPPPSKGGCSGGWPSSPWADASVPGGGTDLPRCGTILPLRSATGEGEGRWGMR